MLVKRRIYRHLLIVRMSTRKCSLHRSILSVAVTTLFCFIALIKLQYHKYLYNSVTSIDTVHMRKETPTVSDTVTKVDVHVDIESVIRCKSQSMGCFNLAVMKEKIDRSEQSSLMSCLHDCSKSTYRYYGKIESTCYCANDSKHLVDIQSWTYCDKTSREDKRIEIFHITESCHKGFPEALVQKYYVGCVPLLPQIFIFDKDKVFRTSAPSIEKCIYLCEERKFPLAMKSREKTTCLCFEPRTVFRNATELETLLKQCDESSKEKSFHLYHTYQENRFCSSRAFLEPNESPVTALASPPGSGNTWMRYLLEVATGIYSGSSYGDKRLRKGGFIGECTTYNSGRTLAVKDHFMKEKNRNYKRAIILLRNPFHALLADYHRKYSGHVGTVDVEKLTLEVFKAYLSKSAPEWLRRLQRYFTHVKGDKVVVLYEDLVDNLLPQMRKVVNFFPRKLIEKYIPSLEDRLVCLILDHTGSFKRPKSEFPYYLFDEEVKTTIRKALDKLRNLFRQNNLGELPKSYSDT
uniref:WSC domain-containing protein 2-like isoform X2 n=1 Tax=Styela clava TaxID=7725 RepID=UPI00193A16F5|nr:WSC domain-containing protein 2-like isoform X2 [Styela clava]